MTTPFLQRFSLQTDELEMPALRLDPTTQTSEIFEDKRWVPSLESASMGRGTKTAVKTEATDYR
jgi:hypothetical protein